MSVRGIASKRLLTRVTSSSHRRCGRERDSFISASTRSSTCSNPGFPIWTDCRPGDGAHRAARPVGQLATLPNTATAAILAPAGADAARCLRVWSLRPCRGETPRGSPSWCAGEGAWSLLPRQLQPSPVLRGCVSSASLSQPHVYAPVFHPGVAEHSVEVRTRAGERTRASSQTGHIPEPDYQ